jgi:hypothetical protein
VQVYKLNVTHVDLKEELTIESPALARRMPNQYYSRTGMWRREEVTHREKKGDGGN